MQLQINLLASFLLLLMARTRTDENQKPSKLSQAFNLNLISLRPTTEHKLAICFARGTALAELKR